MAPLEKGVERYIQSLGDNSLVSCIRKKLKEANNRDGYDFSRLDSSIESVQEAVEICRTMSGQHEPHDTESSLDQPPDLPFM